MVSLSHWFLFGDFGGGLLKLVRWLKEPMWAGQGAENCWFLRKLEWPNFAPKKDPRFTKSEKHVDSSYTKGKVMAR